MASRVNGRFSKVPPADPAELANKRILADRQARLDQKQAEQTLSNDLGLDMKDPEPTADNAADFLSDEWDRKTFGDAIPTYSRVVYGPDPLLVTCPAMKAAIELIGLEEYANATAETILLNNSGSSSSMAPPPWRLTVGAGQPKLRSMPAGASAASCAALSARHSGSLPRSCTSTGVPAVVRLALSSSGQMRRKVRGGNRLPDTRTNSVTAPS